MIILPFCLMNWNCRLGEGLLRVKHWVCCYNPQISPHIIRRFDLAFLDSEYERSLDMIRESSVIIGYLSLGEVNKNRQYFPEIKTFVTFENPNWPGSFLMDVREGIWHELVISELIPEILKKGFQGLVLDTVDNAAYLEGLDPKYKGMREAMISLIKKINKAFPQVYIFTINGLSLFPEAGEVVDGIVAEDVSTSYDFEEKRYFKVPRNQHLEICKRLQSVKKTYKILILSLDYALPSQKELIQYARKEAKKYGFLPYISTIELDQVFFIGN